MKEKEVKEMTNVRKNKMIVTKNQKEEKEMIDMEERKEIENKEGVVKMEKERELIKEIEEAKRNLAEKVVKWAEELKPVKDTHIKIKGRYYPLLGKETGKIYLIDKVKGKKVPFDTLEDKNMKFVILSVLAERKEEIEKEVQEDKRKYLEKKLEEVNELLKKF